VVLQLGTTALQTVNANLRLRLSDAATFDNVVGGQLNDRIVGNALANLILGGPGADDLSGLGDTDVLVGGTGLDTLRGGGPGALLIPDSLDLFPLGTGAFPLAGLNEILFVWSTPNESVSQRLLKLQTGFGSELSWRLTNRDLFVTQPGAEMLRG
jgi:Ca2+-binding RTX toxin-like protein